MNSLILKNILRKEKKRSALVQLTDFELGDIIGTGAFGKVNYDNQVRIIEHLLTRKSFALKYINKEECIKSGTLRNIFRERVILQELDHPNILCLRYAFQDEENLFFVLDWAKGGDVSFNLKRVGTFPSSTLRIYAAELSLALSYLHSHSIIHRDIKPDNLLLDSEGHIYLTDFNCSISTKERIPYSKAGTLEYMAPEMFSGLHYTFSVDWWSMGVVLYQLAYGNSPFKEKTPEATIDAIISKQLEYLGNHDPVLIDFIKGLLEKNSTTRLGCTNNGLGFNDQIKPHALFDGLDWTRLSEMNVGHTPFPTYNYDTKTNQTPMSEDKLSQRVKSIKKKNSGWLVSRVSTAFSCKSIKTDSHSESNLTELGTKSKELMEREMMEKYFVQYNFQSTENVPAVMPPALVGRKRPEGHGQSKVKDHPQVSIPTSRKLTEKSSPLRIGAPESSPNSIQRLKSVKPNQDQCLSPC